MSTLAFQVLVIVAIGAAVFGATQFSEWYQERQWKREFYPILEAQSAALKEAVESLVVDLKRQEVAMIAEIEAARPTDSELIN